MKEKKQDIYFLRWGNLNPVKHKEARGAKEDEWIHVAPCYKGVYAFPRGYVEPFLLGGKYGKHRKKLLKYEGKPILSNDFYGANNDFEIKPQYIKLLKKLHIAKKTTY